MIKIRNLKGFSLVELLVTVLILVSVTAGGYLLFSTGQVAWYDTDGNVQLMENLRKALQKISMELRQTQAGQVQIISGGGGNDDVIKFSVPVICESTGTLIDSNGDVSYWGAPLTWGCTSSTCMDADDDCSTVDYKYIVYKVNADDQLVRQVLTDTNGLVREDLFASNISTFTVTLTGTVVNIALEAQVTTNLNRVLDAQTNMDVYLRN